MKVAVYVRVSTQRQADEDRVSIPEQARELKALAAARGWEIVRPPAFRRRGDLPEGVFGDPGISGDGVTTRPGMVALLEAVEAGQVDAVMVRDLNRLARHELAAQQIHAVLEAHRVLLVTPNMDYDYTNLTHRLMLGLLGSIEAHAKRWLTMNMKRGREAKARQGLFAIRRVDSFGFRWDEEKKRPEVIEAEAEWVRLMFTLAAEGYSLGAIAAELNRRGSRGRGHPEHHPPVPPGRWWGPQVKDVLKNPAYMGRFITYRDPETGEEVEARRDVWGAGDDNPGPPPIVPPELWRAAQGTMVVHRLHRRPAVKKESLLSGFMVCGECGKSLTVRQPDPRHRYYVCNQAARTAGEDCSALHIPAHLLEGPVWAYVQRLQADPKMRRAVARETKTSLLPEWRSRVAQIGAEVKRWQTRLRRAKELLEMGDDDGRGYTVADFADTKAEYEQHVPDLLAEAQALEARIAEAEREVSEVGYVADVLDGAGDLDMLDMSAKRRLLSRLGVHLVVTTEVERVGQETHFTGVKVRLECYGAAVTGLASAVALPSPPCYNGPVPPSGSGAIW